MAAWRPSKMRFELFFKNMTELQSLLALIEPAGITRVNLTNKSKEDPLRSYVQTVRAAIPTADICPHYSIMYQRRHDADSTYESFRTFCREVYEEGVKEVLLLSGSARWEELDTVSVLRRLAAEPSTAEQAMPDLAVAFNTFLPLAPVANEERRRLHDKIATGRVRSVYLQIGSDIDKLQEGLEFMKREIMNGASGRVQLVGSLLVPSKFLLNSLRLKPWGGVFLSEQYLSSMAEADAITRNVIEVYRDFQVVPVVESATRGAADLARIRELLGDFYVVDR